MTADFAAGGDWLEQAFNLACGLLLLTAVGALWRREVSALIPILAVQGAALTAIAAVLASGHPDGGEAVIVAVLVGVLKVIIIPLLLRTTAVFIPITLPFRSRSGPPELPWLMAASVCMRSWVEEVLSSSCLCRPLTTPTVTVCS